MVATPEAVRRGLACRRRTRAASVASLTFHAAHRSGSSAFHAQVEGGGVALGHLARAVVGGAVVPPHQLVEPRGVGAAVGPFATNDAAAHGFDYFQECFFHKNAKDTRFAQGSQRGSDRHLQFA